MRLCRYPLLRRAAASYDRLIRNSAIGACLPSSMTIRHSVLARELKSRFASSAISMRCRDTGAVDSSVASPSAKGTAETVATFPASVSASPSAMPSSITVGIPALKRAATVLSTQMSACTDRVPSGRFSPGSTSTPPIARLRGTSPRKIHASRMNINSAMAMTSRRSRGVEIVSSRSSCSRSCFDSATVLWKESNGLLNTTVRSLLMEIKQGQGESRST